MTPLLPLLMAVSAVAGATGTALPPTTGDATLAIVFDVTGSMWDDLMQVMDGASRILERSLSRGSRTIANYALVPFHDPDIGPVTLTADPAVFQRELRELYVQGGGDCPEMSVGAIKAAVEVANPGSFIYVFSDARAKDYHKKEELLRLLQLKQSQVVFVLTGDCGDRTHPGYLAYEEIAATSSGQVFHLDKQQVTEVLKWVESAIQASRVHLLSTDHEEGGEHTWKIPFDPSLQEVTISLSGPGPEIEIRDPLGRILQKDEGLNVLLSIPDSAKVVAFKPEHPGLWSIKVYSSGRHSVRITGISSIDFRAGFSTQPSLDLNHTIEWPLQGVPISLVINSTGLQAPGRLDSVELSHSSGRSLLTLPTQPLSNGSTHQLSLGGSFLPGRIQGPSPLRAGGGWGSLTGVRVIACPLLLCVCRQSGNSSWEIPRASKAEEGTYECVAASRAGTGRAKAQIVVTDPPPQLVPVPNVTVSPGETAILSCQVLGEAPYNLTWVRDWRVLSASAGRVTQLTNLSLELSGVVPSDSGRYQCMASNSNGVTRASVWLLVREAPQVSIHTRSQRFSQGTEVRVSCSATGYPEPHISWTNGPLAVECISWHDSRVRMDAQGTLIIQGVAPEDAGNYSCQAANEVGTDEETVTLYYADPPSISPINAVVLAAVGEEAVLACKASGVPPPRVIWYRGTLGWERGLWNSPLGPGGLRTVLSGPGGSSRRARLTGHLPADAPQLTELPRDVTVELGRSALLACRATGRPPPTVAWRRGDGQPLGPGRGSRTGVLFFEILMLPLVPCPPDGHPKGSSELTLAPLPAAPPQIASSASTVRVLERQPVSLPCIILAGKPRPERRWLKAGRPVSPGRHSVRADGSLHLDQALLEDAGRYSCVVTNTAGSQHRDVELVVQEVGPVHCGRGRSKSLWEVGGGGDGVLLMSPVTLLQETKALASGDARYNVSKNGTLVIARPSAQDAGAYVCTATNAVGFSSQEMRLSVNSECWLPRPGRGAWQTWRQGHGQSDKPLRVTAKAGHEVTLDCEAQGSPPPLVTWTKDSRPVALPACRHRLLPSGSLYLAQAQVTDGGLYKCTASNPAGSVARNYILGVQVPPQVQPGPRILKVLVGEALDLNCAAKGSPEPQLTWSKDGVALQGGEPEGSVHFTAIQTADAGTYRCEASSSAGADAWELELRVLEPPHWGADETSGLLERVAGENATLPCPARGTPKPQVTWRKGPSLEPVSGRPGLAVLEEGSLFLDSVSPTDGGDYECQATNEAGSASRRAKLVVHGELGSRSWGMAGTPGCLGGALRTHLRGAGRGPAQAKALWPVGLVALDNFFHPPTPLAPVPPSVLGAGAAQEVLGLAGAGVELECQTTGIPAPQVEWTKDGQPVLPGDPRVQLQEDGQVLRITSTHLGDEGRYQCVAFSPAGQQAKDFQLRIHSPPTIWGSNETSEVAVVEGHPVRFLCEARGVPTPDITWLKDGDPLLPSAEAVYTRGGRQLQLEKAQGSDAGIYTCKASNPVGVVEKATRLEVYGERPGVSAGTADPSGGRWEGLWAVVASGEGASSQGSLGGSPEEAMCEEGLQLWAGGEAAFHMGRGEGGASSGCWSLSSPHASSLVPPAIEGAGRGPHVVKAVAGRPLALECVARGRPPPTLSWHHKGLPVTESNGTWLAAGGSVLSLESLGEASGGLYSCVASSPAGEAMLQYSVEVPSRMPVTQVQSGGLAGSLAPLFFFPDISWFKGHQPVSARKGVTVSADGRVLLIERARFSDAGSYRCVASNVAGRTELQYGLRVNGDLPGPVLLHSPVRLSCNATGVPSPMLMWLKDGNPVSTAGTSGLQVFPGGRVLTLASARASDSGSYTCVAVSAVGEDRRDVVLHVHMPPSILGEELNVSVVANESVALDWRKDGRPLEPRPGIRLSADKALLEVDRAEVWDAGRYSCEALNQAGRSEKHYNLNVWVPPEFPSQEPRTLTVMEGHPARLSCECRGVPFPKISWRKDGRMAALAQPHPHCPTGGGCSRPMLVAEGNTGHTEVSAGLGAGGQLPVTRFPPIPVPPQIVGPREPHIQVSVVQDEEATLECNATGKPLPRVTWERDGQPVGAEPGLWLQDQGRSLHVERAQATHAGRYSCVAENVAGRAERRFELSVLALLGSPASCLTCLSPLHTGHPQPNVTWFKDGRPLAGGDTYRISPEGGLLQVLQANLSNAGHYSCIAANAIGEKTKHFQLSVTLPPPLRYCFVVQIFFNEHMPCPATVVPTILGAAEDSADEEVTVTVNNPISLICEALAFPSPTITWMKDGAPFEASNNIQLLPGTHGLQILNAQKEDAGQYTCLVTNELGEAMKNYHVEVLIPPSISKDDPSGEVGVKEVKTKVNSTLTLDCESWAVPPPTISWYKDGRPVTPNQRVHILGEGRLLQIQPTQLSDSGRYLCVATNVAGEDDQDFNVLIQVPPMFQKVGDASAPFETLSQMEEARGGVTEYREIVENNPAYLYCDTNAVPPPELTWYREDQPLSAADGASILQGGRVLQIPLVRAEDAGRYSCKASNEVGEDWLHYELLVLTPPVILGDTEELVEEVTVNASSTVSLQCPALGNPAPSISWLQNGLPFSPSPRLQVSTAEVADAASYMCVAENPAGSAEKLFTLRVQAPPRIAGLNSEQVTAVLGNSVSLPCEVHAHPSPEVTWYKDGRALPLGEKVFLLPGTHTLQLAQAQPSDSGMYTCEALNAAGRDQKQVQLSVLVPPKFKQAPSGPQDAIVVRAGDTAVLNCETDSFPEAAVTWHKDGQPLVLAQRTQALHHAPIPSQVLDKGLYSCRVSNAAGEAVRTFILTVQVPPTFENPKTEIVSQTAGSPLVLSCDVTGVPAPTVTWLKDRMPVESSVAHGVVSRGGRLQLSHLQPAQAGTYTCVAENAQAEARKDFVVAVPMPAPAPAPSLTHSVLEGQEVRLDCEADGQPPPDVAWLKDGGPLGQGTGPHLRFYRDGSSLVLKGLRASDSGAYTCVAHNAAGEDARLHTVNVLGDRPGELVTLGCPVRGSPPIHVSWLKDGLPLPLSQRTHLHGSGRTLRISQVQLADSGIFTCVAASPAGVANRNFTLQVHEFQNDVVVVQGSPVVLPCEARGSPLPLVSWMKNGEPLLPQSLEQGPGLQLETVGAGDSGTYSCVAVSEAGEARRHFQLTVMDPPHIEDSGQPAELSLIPGAPLELLCDARGTPTPNITWHKDGQALSRPADSSGAGRVLRVEGVQVGDAGLYTCLAQNPAGEIEKSFRVRVQAPPNVIGPQGPRFVVGLAPGQLVLECSVKADPAPEIEWHRDGILLQVGARLGGRFLQLQALSTADSGDYSCTARNAAGSTSVAFRVEIRTVPSIRPGPPAVNASANQTALLPCQADGTPPPLVSWRKDGVPLDPGSPRFQLLPEGSLRIQPVLAQDAGHYLCLASNSAGSDRQGLDLQVFEPPAIAPGPSNLTLTAHSPASLPCEASGSPKPLVVWWKDGQKLDFRQPSVCLSRLLPSNALLLAAPGPGDSAQFECVVSNEVGEARRLYWVTVHVPPTIADDQTDFTVTMMAPVVLTCHSTGVPAPVVSWSKAGTRLGARGNGYRVSPSGALEIGQALPIHAGRYTCTARNAVGVAHKHVVLTVRGMCPLVQTKEVLLPCEASGIPRPSITWQREGLSVPTGECTQVLPGGQLRIIHVSPEDAGNYFCIAQNSAGSAMGKTRLVVHAQLVVLEGVQEDTSPMLASDSSFGPLRLLWPLVGNWSSRSNSHLCPFSHCVCLCANGPSPSPRVDLPLLTVPPVIKPGLPDLSATEGSHALLPCAASGSPEPSITWEKDGQPLSGAEGKFTVQPSGELLVKNSKVRAWSRGRCWDLHCTAENTVGRARRRVHLTVLALPVFTTLPGDRSLRFGDKLWLRCAARGSPTPRIGWIVNDRPDGGSTLQRVAVTREHGGTYICWAENRVGRVQAVSFVHVKEAPVLQGEAFSYLVAPVGGSVRLDCAVHGDPAPDIHWIKDGLPLRGSRLRHRLQNGSLTIRRTEMDDAGQYQCLAENEMGAVEKVVVLVLQSESRPRPGDVTVRSGDAVALRCQATGEPAPTVEWLHGGQPLRTSRRLRTLPDGSLWLERVEAGDAGTYECVAHNLLGSATARAFLAVRGMASLPRPCGIPCPMGFMCCSWGTSQLPNSPLCLESRTQNEPSQAVVWAILSTLPFRVGETECRHIPRAQRWVTSFLSSPFLAGEPRGSRGSMIGLINGHRFGVATLNTSRLPSDGSDSASAPTHSGPLMRVLVVTLAPVYWALARESGDALNGHSLTGGSFQQQSQVEFATGELLTMTQVARGLDPNGLLLLDVAVNGVIPESLADDFQEQYVQVGPGRLFVGSTQSFLQDSLPTLLRCNHSIQYDAAQGPQPQLVQHLRVSAIRSAFDPEAEALHFQLSTALQAVGCPEGFELDTQGEFCVDRDECLGGPSPCSHACHNAPGRFSCSCPAGFALAKDGRNCKDVNECAWDGDLCREGQRCMNLLGSYRCLPDCGPGFQVAADGASCEAPDLCDPSPPWVDANTDIPSRGTGLEGDGDEAQRCPQGEAWCVLGEGARAPHTPNTPPTLAFPDVDECLEQMDECHPNQICENTPGGHRCSCPRGYRIQGPGLPCLDINECLQLPRTCAYQCHNLQGSYRCLCPPGQTLLRDGKTCTPLEHNVQNVTTVSHRGPLARGHPGLCDSGFLCPHSLRPPLPTLRPGPDLDECQVGNLCQHACRNTEGSYQCLCPAGYRLLPSGKNCQDINECEEDGIECGPSQMCFNTRGSYQCVDTPCPATYRQGSSPGTCFRRCSQDCSAGGPSTLQYKLLPLPLGVRPLHDVARLAAFSEAGVPVNRTELTVLEPDPRSPFALRQLRAGHGAVYTRRALTRAGLYRVFVLLIAVSPYPY
uniref:Hemicentin-2 n=1 Tax=Sus scrofa TaxID=9823 RepID=A0A5G2Q6R4_PIG